MLLLILSLLKTNISAKKRDDKKDFIQASSLGIAKIVLKLLAKIIAIYIGFFEIEI